MLKVTASLLEDPAIANEELDLERVFKEDEDRDGEDYKGFCVYGDKMTLFGHNGLNVTNIELGEKSIQESLPVINSSNNSESTVNPTSVRFLAPVINWFFKKG